MTEGQRPTVLAEGAGTVYIFFSFIVTFLLPLSERLLSIDKNTVSKSCLTQNNQPTTSLQTRDYKRLELFDRFPISASECLEDSVAKFTSLLRARD